MNVACVYIYIRIPYVCVVKCMCASCHWESVGIIWLYKSGVWQLPSTAVVCLLAANVSHSSHISVAQTEVRPPVQRASFGIEILNRRFCEMLSLLQLLCDCWESVWMQRTLSFKYIQIYFYFKCFSMWELKTRWTDRDIKLLFYEIFTSLIEMALFCTV